MKRELSREQKLHDAKLRLLSLLYMKASNPMQPALSQGERDLLAAIEADPEIAEIFRRSDQPR